MYSIIHKWELSYAANVYYNEGVPVERVLHMQMTNIIPRVIMQISI